MAYKGKSVTVASSSHLITEIKALLLSCGWVDDTPSNQDDADGFILGHFLSSSGESGNDDLHMHLSLNRNYVDREWAEVSYLDGAINDTVTTIPIRYVTGLPTEGKVRIGNEVITYSGLSGGSLTGCTRGWGISVSAVHSDNDAVLFVDGTATTVYTGRVQIELYAYKDLDNGLLASTNAKSWALASDQVTNVVGLTGFGDTRLAWGALLRVNDIGSPDNGKMRWIKSYTSAGGDFTYQPFVSAPGAVECDIVSGGFFPVCSRRVTQVSTYYPPTGRLRADTQIGGTTVYLYGSKDGVWAVTKEGSVYYPAYFGNAVGGNSPLNTNTNADAAAGANTVSVVDTTKFLANQKYRIISQSYLDWIDNKDRQVGSGWPPLDPEESATEEVIVQSVGVGSVTFTSNLIYSYKSGAVIGEVPRPAVRYSSYNGNYPSAVWSWLEMFNNCEASVIGAHASHRQHFRAYHVSGDPKTPMVTSNSVYMALSFSLATIMAGTYIAGGQPWNRQTGQLVLNPITVERSESTEARAIFGQFNRYIGVLPMVWWSNNKPPLGASAEDTVSAAWGGAYETFRIIPEGSSNWLIFGPEIA